MKRKILHRLIRRAALKAIEKGVDHFNLNKNVSDAAKLVLNNFYDKKIQPNIKGKIKNIEERINTAFPGLYEGIYNMATASSNPAFHNPSGSSIYFAPGQFPTKQALGR